MTHLDFLSPPSVLAWRPIDDRVMGGVSQSRLRHDPAGHAIFEGHVSPDNGGGFASVRCADAALGSAATQAYRLRVLGDGRRYKLQLRTDEGFDGLNHQAAFQPPAGQWCTLDIPLAAFSVSFRGRPQPDAPPLAPERVRQVGLLIADKQWGPFALCLSRMECVERPVV